MKTNLNQVFFSGLLFFLFLGFFLNSPFFKNFLPTEKVLSSASNNSSEDGYWFLLHRKSNVEYLFFGTKGDRENSRLIRQFTVKTGVPGEKPTPLPKMLGEEYWVITKKEPSDNPETSPYFLALNIPVTDEPPFGPVPYEECKGDLGSGQCDWELPGEFGLHGTGGDSSKLSESDEGSSGCIRHSDSDISYLYELLDPQSGEIRYYIEDL